MNIIHNSNDEQAKTKTTRTDKVLPAGTYEAEIVKATARQSEYSKSNDNPDGWELSLWIDVHHEGKRFRVFNSIPITHVNRISQALAAAGLPVLSAGMKSFEESVLHGQTVTIRTFVSKAGKARIGDYIAPKAVIPGKKAGPSRGKVDASDIPF